VLVETRSAGNLGSAARALKNLGFARLAVVRPACDPRSAEAARMAVDAADLLEAAVVCETLAEALDGARTVVGTSRRTGKHRRPHYRLDAFAGELARLARAGEIAFVFGREDHGLADEDLDRCTHLVHLPASDDYPSFNLAQAVLLIAWELRRATLLPDASDPLDAPALQEEREAFYTHMQRALGTIGYIHRDTVTPIMRRLRRLLGRASMTSDEVKLLRGMARQILWAADRAGLPARDGTEEDE
jgi:tRNA/rRNA methyltransferase